MEVSVKHLISKLLADHGFNVKLDSTLTGRSGLKHSFDIVAVKKAQTICFEIIDIDEGSLVKTLGKAIDISPAKIFLVSSRRATSFMAVSGIGNLEVIFYGEIEEIKDIIERKILSHLNTMINCEM